VRTLPDGRAPICPLLSTAQIVQLGFVLQGEAGPGGPSLDLASLKSGRPSSAPGSYRFGAVASPNFKTNLKPGEQPDPQNPPPPLADPLTIRCIGDQCVGWNMQTQDCRMFERNEPPAVDQSIYPHKEIQGEDS
jgi:hypothetical protein